MIVRSIQLLYMEYDQSNMLVPNVLDLNNSLVYFIVCYKMCEQSAGKKLREARYINKSLCFLEQVRFVMALRKHTHTE